MVTANLDDAAYERTRREFSMSLWQAECKRLGRTDGTLPDEAGERVYLEARLLARLIDTSDRRRADIDALEARIAALEGDTQRTMPGMVTKDAGADTPAQAGVEPVSEET